VMVGIQGGRDVIQGVLTRTVSNAPRELQLVTSGCMKCWYTVQGDGDIIQGFLTRTVSKYPSKLQLVYRVS